MPSPSSTGRVELRARSASAFGVGGHGVDRAEAVEPARAAVAGQVEGDRAVAVGQGVEHAGEHVAVAGDVVHAQHGRPGRRRRRAAGQRRRAPVVDDRRHRPDGEVLRGHRRTVPKEGAASATVTPGAAGTHCGTGSAAGCHRRSARGRVLVLDVVQALPEDGQSSVAKNDARASAPAAGSCSIHQWPRPSRTATSAPKRSAAAGQDLAAGVVVLGGDDDERRPLARPRRRARPPHVMAGWAADR